mmetsp:Transcript_114339/g.210170  ORF Transcript_114339/g.210170 Transcript_114339/m.210170 type:complete len:282 (+) Transcript_114339:79-924(+)
MNIGQFIESGLPVSVMLPWIIGLFVAFISLSMAFQKSSFFKDKPIAAAHQVVVIVPFTFLAVRGTWLWFFDPDFVAAFDEDKVFGKYLPSLEFVCVMLAFQIWDFSSTFAMCKELKGQAQHIAHHASVILLCCSAVLSGTHGFLLYYAPFFFGVAEISSLPLAFMDLFKYSKPLAEAYPVVFENVRTSFAVLFLLLRCIYWPFVSVDFWRAMLASDAPLGLQILWYFFNLALTLLQFYWGSLVVKGIIKMLKGQNPIEARELGDALYPEAGEGSQGYVAVG